MNRCVILCAGPVEDAAALAALLRPSDMIIAADGGRRLADTLGVRPRVIVSDFDSSAMPTDEKDVTVVHLPVRKDVTDAAAAVDYGWAAGYREFLLLGGTGGRLDHEYANYQLLVQLAQRGGRGMLADNRNRVEAVCRSPVWPEPMP